MILLLIALVMRVTSLVLVSLPILVAISVRLTNVIKIRVVSGLIRTLFIHLLTVWFIQVRIKSLTWVDRLFS